MATPRITLDQWQALLTVVDSGSYAKAAEALHKSQSSLTYAVQKLESLLGVKAFEIKGRKAVLTATGQLLYRRARALLTDASGLEQAARCLSAGWEAEIYVAVDVVFPTWLLLQSLRRFSAESAHTRIEVVETVLGGTNEALLQGQADLAISGRIPQGFAGDALMRLRFVPAAHPAHPLHKLGRTLTHKDLDGYVHLVVRESGSRRSTNALTVETTQRWTFSAMTTSIEAARTGCGFAWYPEEKIRDELAAGTLKQLPLRDGGERFVELYLIFADRDYAGPGTLRLAEIIREEVARACVKRVTPAAGPSRATRDAPADAGAAVSPGS